MSRTSFRSSYYVWTRDLARNFLLGIDSELSWLQLGVSKRKPYAFIVVLDNKGRADLLCEQIIQKGGYVGRRNHGKKTSWIHFMIPAQARAWNKPTYRGQ